MPGSGVGTGPGTGSGLATGSGAGGWDGHGAGWLGAPLFSPPPQATRSTATINTLLTNNKDSVNSGMQGLNELAPAVRELRETLGSLRAISRRLEANPSGYLLGSDKNKEFTP